MLRTLHISWLSIVDPLPIFLVMLFMWVDHDRWLSNVKPSSFVSSTCSMCIPLIDKLSFGFSCNIVSLIRCILSLRCLGPFCYSCLQTNKNKLTHNWKIHQRNHSSFWKNNLESLRPSYYSIYFPIFLHMFQSEHQLYRSSSTNNRKKTWHIANCTLASPWWNRVLPCVVWKYKTSKGKLKVSVLNRDRTLTRF